MDQSEAKHVEAAGATLLVWCQGMGPPLLLLHGFPQTSLMWRYLAERLAHRFTVVCADLRGYGGSSCPLSAPDHSPYSKRAMAADLVTVMDRLGFSRWSVVGHDRGGRVAYRLALDHPDRISRLAVLDVVPTESAWERADARFALGFWPWALLAQPAPLPESILAVAADAILDSALGGWGTPAATFTPEVRAAYLDALRDPAHVHAICEEYRAAAAVDREHDRADRANGRRIACPLFVIWSARGPLADWYGEEGPLAIWREWASDVQGCAIDAGHFFPEEAPDNTFHILTRFLDEATP